MKHIGWLNAKASKSHESKSKVTSKATSSRSVCLSGSHLTTACGRRTRYTNDGCNGIHHPLLRTKRDLKTSATRSRKGLLSIVKHHNGSTEPLGMVPSKRTIRLSALLGGGSDTTLDREGTKETKKTHSFQCRQQSGNQISECSTKSSVDRQRRVNGQS